MKKLHKSEGDINISPKREEWQKKHIDAASRRLLDEDSRYFLKQSLSTPCLNTLQACEGIYIEDMQGRRYMDFHGNNVHQVGFANPDVMAAIKKQLDELSFCTRRYTNRVAVDLAKKLAVIAPGNLNKSLFCPGGAEAVGIRFTAPPWTPFPSAVKPSSAGTWARCCPEPSMPRRPTNTAVYSAAQTAAVVT
jgi:4-aminobutyrate aminotransferase